MSEVWSHEVMHRVVYVSDAVGTAGASILSIAQILGVSYINNRRDQITGLLVCHRGQFLQVIEGRRADLDRLMRRLHEDPRHTHLRLRFDEAVKARRFGDEPLAQVEVVDEVALLIGDDRLEQLDLLRIEAVFANGAARTSVAA